MSVHLVGCCIFGNRLRMVTHSILWGDSAGFAQVTNFLPSYGRGEFVTLAF